VAAGAIVAQYGERVRQGQQSVMQLEHAARSREAEIESLRRQVLRMKTQLQQAQDANDSAAMRARELEQERNQLRRYLTRSMSPRFPVHGRSEQTMRPIQA
jgi:septal ring factor EnvC (AmiA/AmiB activator)